MLELGCKNATEGKNWSNAHLLLGRLGQRGHQSVCLLQQQAQDAAHFLDVLHVERSLAVLHRLKMLAFKFEQNRTINEQFDFFEGRGTSFLNFNLNYYWYTYKTVLFQISVKSQYK